MLFIRRAVKTRARGDPIPLDDMSGIAFTFSLIKATSCDLVDK